MNAAEHREAKLELRGVPFRRERVAGLPEFLEHAEKILPEDVVTAEPGVAYSGNHDSPWRSRLPDLLVESSLFTTAEESGDRHDALRISDLQAPSELGR